MVPLRLRINQPVEITLLEPERRGPLRTYVLAADGERVVLALPMAHHRWIVPPPGSPVQVVYRDPADDRADRGLYGFETVVIKAAVEPEPELHLEAPRRVERVQRRHWVRLDVSLPVWLARVDAPEEERSGRTRDLSGGGVRLRCDEPLKPGDLVALRILFPGGWEVAARGRVVRAEQGTDAQPEYGIQFIDIDPRAQDRIAGFILAEQARRRRLLG